MICFSIQLTQMNRENNMKALLQGLSVIAMLLVMAACGGGNESEMPAEDTTVIETPIAPEPIAPIDTTMMDTTMVDTTAGTL